MRKTKAETMETRRRILGSALDIFSEKNFSNVSVSEIAEAVGKGEPVESQDKTDVSED